MREAHSRGQWSVYACSRALARAISGNSQQASYTVEGFCDASKAAVAAAAMAAAAATVAAATMAS